METITSKDGTPIACQRSGEGPPLVLVHGSISDHAYWEPVLPALERRRTVYTIDRRGYGQSGDHADGYAIEREFEDVAAVVKSIGEPVSLLGHSYGAICALEGARLVPRYVDRLILYEPPINASAPPGFVERLEAMLAAGDREGVISTFVREIEGLEPEEVPAWREWVPFAHTLPRELRAAEAYAFEAVRFRALGMPTLVLGGDESPSFLQEGNRIVAEALPDTRVAVMNGQGHEAVETGPKLLVDEVLRFLTTYARRTLSQPRLATLDLATGVRLHYAEQGDPNGEAVIFLHGYSDSWFSFSQVLSLLPARYHAFALTERGHGDSDKPECCYTLDDFAADVDAFMDAVRIEEATLVGHSGGSFIAQRAAFDYPGRVSRLVLIGSATTLSNNEGVGELGKEMLALEDPVPPEFVREFQESTVYHPVPEGFFETVVSESLKFPAHVWRDYWKGVVLTVDHASRLGEIEVPTLILWGEQDTLFPREEQERLTTAIPGAALRVYPETGHALHWERPDQFVQDLEAFMKETRPASVG